MEKEKLLKNALFYAIGRKSMLHDFVEPEDFVSYVNELLLKKPEKKLIIKYAFIDFLRKFSGRKDSKNYDKRKTVSREAKLDKMKDFGFEAKQIDKELSAVINNIDTQRLLDRIEKSVDDEEFKYIKLLIMGYSVSEVGKFFDIEYSTIYHRITKITQKKLPWLKKYLLKYVKN